MQDEKYMRQGGQMYVSINVAEFYKLMWSFVSYYSPHSYKVPEKRKQFKGRSCGMLF